MLSSVVFFFRIWNSWLEEESQKADPAFCRDNNGISHQASCDLEICVGAFCTVVGIVSDFPEFQHIHGKYGFDPERMVWLLCCGVMLTEFYVAVRFSITGHGYRGKVLVTIRLVDYEQTCNPCERRA